MKPIIGITPNFIDSTGQFSLHKAYVFAIEDAGGIPVILLPTAIPIFVHGIVLSGGADIDPLFFDQEPILHGGEINPMRDTFELALAATALEENIPILGICRGMQVMNIATGGTLYQDIPTQTTSSLKHLQQAPRDYPTHSVFFPQNTLLWRMFQANYIRVNSFHHQGVCVIGDGFLSIGESGDGIVEAILHKTHPFALGVQWHPETLHAPQQKELFTILIQKSKEQMNHKKEDCP